MEELDSNSSSSASNDDMESVKEIIQNTLNEFLATISSRVSNNSNLGTAFAENGENRGIDGVEKSNSLQVSRKRVSVSGQQGVLRKRNRSEAEADGKHRCSNKKCEHTSNEIEDLPKTLHFFFQIAASGKNRSFGICKDCKVKAEKYLKDAQDAIKQNKPVCAIPTELGSVSSIIDLDDDDDDDNLPSEIMQAPINFEETLDAIIASFGLEQQTAFIKEELTVELSELEEAFNQEVIAFNDINNEVGKLLQGFEKLTGPRYRVCLQPSLDIDEYGQETIIPLSPSEVERNNDILKLHFLSSQADAIDLTDDVDDNEVLEVQPSCDTATQTLAPTPVVVPELEPRVGDKMYVLNCSTLNSWILGEVIGICTDNKIRVKYDMKVPSHLNGMSGPRTPIQIEKSLSAMHLACTYPCEFILPVGTRVIGLFETEFRSASASKRSNYYAGIVAEPPSSQNKYRYLIFFDDGYAQYVDHSNVFRVCQSSKETWIDVHPDTQDFIKSYVRNYPERPMLRLVRGQIVTTEYNGKWFSGKVLEVDCSLVKLQFINDNRKEWIYRGSARLAPLYNQLRRLTEATCTGRPAKHLRTKFTIECFPDDFIRDDNMAESSGGLTRLSDDEEYPNSNMHNSFLSSLSNSLKEYEGKMHLRQIPSSIAGPRPYLPHKCNSTNCVRNFDEHSPELKNLNPLAYPMYMGWSRSIVKRPKTGIYYTSPCGKRLRNYDDLHVYLTETDCNLSIDFFCFDFSVDCMSDFIPTQPLRVIKDISFGKELVNISSVNSVDDSSPDFVDYTRERLPAPDVAINLDDEFLSCCDCTDDCMDKSKCSCWALTMQGIQQNPFAAKGLERGYEHRRLIDHIVTGIYECNHKCKCKKTCSNRVVQNPLRLQLQIFKTSNKGWAIRALNDLPGGTFLCVYAGQLLTDQGANEDGATYGDEYLAELDYIEVAEEVKDGYEADAIEPSLNYENSQDGEFAFPRQRGRSARRHSGGSDCASRSGVKNLTRGSESVPTVNTRELFGQDDGKFIMDAKAIGNVGRYLNHSCQPNVFVQNVFVDTHDIRFPWVAFFTSRHIRAGTELTWDYSYQIGSVPGKTLYCYCGTPECRGRLL